MDLGFDNWFDSLSKEKQNKMMYSALVTAISIGLFAITILVAFIYKLIIYVS